MPIEDIKANVFYHIHSGDWREGETHYIGENDNGFLESIFIKDYFCIKERSDELGNLIRSGFIPDFIDQNTEEIFFLNNILNIIRRDAAQEDPVNTIEDLVKTIENRKSKIQHQRKQYNEIKIPNLAGLMSEYIELCGILRNFLLIIREGVFEEIRMESYQEHPSRKKCLWVIANNQYSNDSIKFWWNELNRKGQLLRLELTGSVFHTNEQHLPMTFKSIDQLRQKADLYWRGLSGEDPIRDEYLFVGDAKVLDVTCKDYETFEANGLK